MTEEEQRQAIEAAIARIDDLMREIDAHTRRLQMLRRSLFDDMMKLKAHDA